MSHTAPAGELLEKLSVDKMTTVCTEGQLSASSPLLWARKRINGRVSANKIMSTEAPEVLIHHNIASLGPNVDPNVLSVINYAVRHLQSSTLTSGNTAIAAESTQH